MNKTDFNIIKSFIENKGGEILITKLEYKNSQTPFAVKCNNGHIWNVSWSNLQKCKWCPHCIRAAITINDAIDLAKTFNGTLISEVYKNINDPLLWRCENEHIFRKSYYGVSSRGSWCNICSSKWKSEEICRIYFETIFEKQFPKVRPNWLRNKDGNKLELDGFCKELQLAFEHNGAQHYVEGIFDYLGSTDFSKIQQNDNDKKELCFRHGIRLIIIPRLHKWTTLPNLEDLVKSIAITYGVKLKDNYTYDLSNLTKSQFCLDKLEKLKNICSDMGGKCLSDAYLTAKTYYTFSCKRNHIWKTTYDKIVNGGTWCEECHHIDQIKNTDFVNMTKEDLEEAYTTHKSIKLMAKYFHISSGIIKRLFNQHNIEIKGTRPTKLFETKETLYDLYITQELSTNKMADIFNVDPKTIYYRLLKYNIPIRKTWKRMKNGALRLI